MCLSGRCSSCQHRAIDAGINHHDLHAVTQFVGRGLRSTEDKPDPIIIELTDEEVLKRMGRAMKHETTDTVVMSKKNDG